MRDQWQPSLTGSLWRFRWMSAAIVLGMLGLSIAVGIATAPRIQATATIALKIPRGDSVLAAGVSGDASLGRYTVQRARFVTSDAVITAVAERLGRTDITALRGAVSADPSGTSNTIVIVAEADSRAEAVDLANAVIDAYRSETEKDVERLTAAAIDSIDASAQEVIESSRAAPASEFTASSAASTLSQLALQASELRFSSALLGDGVEFVVAPRADAVVLPSIPVREAALGLIIGLALAATASWIRADRDRGVVAPLHPESVLRAPFLGSVPAVSHKELPRPVDLGALPSHDYRIIWTAVLRRSLRVLQVASKGTDARSIAALNLAVAAAREDRSVLLVDADVATGSLSSLLGQGGGRPGLRELLLRGGDHDQYLARVSIGGTKSMTLLPSGYAVSGDIDVSTQSVQAMVAEWRRGYDIVVIDAAAVGSSQLAAMLCGAADGVLVVVSKGADELALEEVRRGAALQGTPIIGYAFASMPSRTRRGRRRGYIDPAGRQLEAEEDAEEEGTVGTAAR